MEASSNNRRIFVKDASKLLSDQALTSYFNSFGKIEDIEIVKDILGNNKGFSFVTFADDKSFRKALRTTHSIDGYKLKVEEARPIEEKIVNRIDCPRTFAILQIDHSFSAGCFLTRYAQEALCKIWQNRECANNWN